MTAFSTIAGILPIAIGFGAGAESRRRDCEVASTTLEFQDWQISNPIGWFEWFSWQSAIDRFSHDHNPDSDGNG